MPLFDAVFQDLRYGLRMLRRNPWFTIVTTLTLALGIGVNTAGFTAYEAFFSRMLDARDPARLVNLALILHSGKAAPFFSYPDHEAYRDGLHSFSGVIAQDWGKYLTLSDAGEDANQGNSSLAEEWGLLPTTASNKEHAVTVFVSENYFSVFGIVPWRGRAFGSAAELAASPAALVSENY